MAGEQTSKPNFFILLGVNPDEQWDQAKFDATLEEKRKEWSRKSSAVGNVRIEAQRNLALYGEIKSVMSDPAQRDLQAAAARKERTAGQSARIEQFERQLEMLASKGYLEQSQVDRLVADFKDVLSEKEIRSRIKVEVRTPDPQAGKTQQQLEPATVKAIDERLRILQKQDLYDLLGMSPSVSSDQLLKAAQALAEDMLRRQPKTQEVTIKAELAGHAKTIFKTEETRHKYNESLRYSTLNVLLEEFEKPVTMQNGLLYSGQVAMFLERATNARWSQDEALARLKEYAQKRKWFVEVPTIQIGVEKQRCGNCNQLNEKGREYCAKCNGQLRFNCPDCGQPVGSDDVGCGKCGFPVGNRYWIDTLLNECQTLLAQHDVKTADEQLKLAEGAWMPKRPDTRLKRMQEYRTEIQRYTQARQQSVERLKDYLNKRRFLTARDYLAQQSADTIPERETYLHTINAEIAQAQTLLRQAKAAMNTEQKIELCVQALHICADYQEARDLLSTVPPSPPTSLSIKRGSDTISLQWNPSPTRGVSYKIVRKTRSQPVSVKDGQVLATVSGRVYDDTQPEIGMPTFYAVFAALEDIPSLEAAMLQRPVLLPAEVNGVKTRIDSQLVELTWKAPPNVQAIVVVRKEKMAPVSITDGVQLAPLDLQHLVDRAVQNDCLYFYSIFCKFKEYDGSILTSAGVTVSATPETPPEIINRLDISSQKGAQGYEVQLRWQKPRKGRAVVLKSPQLPTMKPGESIPVNELKRFGVVLEEHPDSCMDRATQVGILYYTPVVILQNSAYVGTPQALPLIEDVSDLRYQNLGTAIRLNWNWPANCQEVFVAFAYDGYPQPNRATPHARVMRAEYEHRGFYDIRGNLERDHYIIVAAVVRQGDTEIIGPGARVQARLFSKLILSYEIKLPRMFGPKKRILSISARMTGKLPNLLLVSKQGRLPLRREEGEAYFRLQGPTPIENMLEFELPDRSFGPKTFGKLYLEDDGLYEMVTIHHPSEDKLRLS